MTRNNNRLTDDDINPKLGNCLGLVCILFLLSWLIYVGGVFFACNSNNRLTIIISYFPEDQKTLIINSCPELLLNFPTRRQSWSTFFLLNLFSVRTKKKSRQRIRLLWCRSSEFLVAFAGALTLLNKRIEKRDFDDMLLRLHLSLLLQVGIELDQLLRTGQRSAKSP